MFQQLLAMFLQMQFHTFEKRALLKSGAISKYLILFPIDGQRFLQSVFSFQLHCFDFLFGGVKRPIYYRTQYILSLKGGEIRLQKDFETPYVRPGFWEARDQQRKCFDSCQSKWRFIGFFCLILEGFCFVFEFFLQFSTTF